VKYYKYVRTKFPSFKTPKFKHTLSVFRAYIKLLKKYISTDILKTTTDLIIESNILKTAFRHLESLGITAHALENKICTFMQAFLPW